VSGRRPRAPGPGRRPRRRARLDLTGGQVGDVGLLLRPAGLEQLALGPVGVHLSAQRQQGVVVGRLQRRSQRADPRCGAGAVALRLVRAQGGRVLEDEGTDQLRPAYRRGEGDRPAEGVPEDDGGLGQLLEQAHRVLDHEVARVAGELLGREPRGRAVTPLVDRDDREAVLPVTHRLRPAGARVGEAVEQQEGRCAREVQAVRVDGQVGVERRRGSHEPVLPGSSGAVTPGWAAPGAA
jgi:hypothetical protein